MGNVPVGTSTLLGHDIPIRNSWTVAQKLFVMKWAIFLLFPLSAKTMSKAAVGICDNFLLCVSRAWPFGPNHLIKKPILILKSNPSLQLQAFPAMNTNMWNHPSTKLIAWGWRIVNPPVKYLACGDIGIGALPEVPDVVSSAKPLPKEKFQT
eukprot:Gregarina_sp_Poly_1__10076@NODE_680_length_6809_cov_177_847375_g513_i0_p4_GENE_NODE_680_length_6809_cov_177_847375_g513_i0NODE_680_length_6809_cov_177_847375_g513_i0_p4_ORF_typecomplete_len152_score10_62Flavoprotein/PF02441_19/5_9e13Avian_gp85/PF03708_14/0_43Avian_gp85/PF03708_14/1_5e03_NODE_680_length_6809_cov_177_847375_g513_i056316086